MHILPQVTAEGYDGSHHPKYAEWWEVLVKQTSGKHFGMHGLPLYDWIALKGVKERPILFLFIDQWKALSNNKITVTMYCNPFMSSGKSAENENEIIYYQDKMLTFF